jgi:hypothetical protein
MCKVGENQALEWRSTVTVCQNSGKKCVFQAITLSFCFSCDMAFDIQPPVNSSGASLPPSIYKTQSEHMAS